MIEIIPYGSSALLVQFEQKISSDINDQVIALNKFAKTLPAVIATIPAYCSLVITFNSETTFSILKQALMTFKMDNLTSSKGRKLRIPVCFDEEYALDLKQLEKELDLSQAEIIRLFCERTYSVFMMGFLPGFGYMGKLPKALECRRKANPRKEVPALSVGMAGRQTGIYPFAAPGGWQIIGQTAIPLFSDAYQNTLLFQVGDRVTFEPVTAEKFEEIKNQPINPKLIYG